MNTIRTPRLLRSAQRQGLCRAGDLVARILAMYGIRVDELMSEELAAGQNTRLMAAADRRLPCPQPGVGITAASMTQQTFAWFETAKVQA